MRVTYIGPFDAVEVVGQVVERGATFEVDAETGNSLCEQETNWQAAKPVSKKTEE